jgi:hypothetical protein
MQKVLRSAALGVLIIFAGSGEVRGQDTARDLIDTPSSPSGYERLLKEFVIREPLPGGGFDTRIDYSRLAADPESRKLCEEIKDRFLSVNPLAMDQRTRQAWAVNAYNFLVIDLVVNNLHTPEGGDLASIADIGGGNFEVFDEPLEVGDHLTSLNHLERFYVFLGVDRDAETIPELLDPRFHFALVCGARGCPPLWPVPFQPESLDEQLEEATRNALMNPRQIHLDGRIVRVSKIFEWYEVDFTHAGGVEGFLGQYAPEHVRSVINTRPRRMKVLPDIEWDWSLNRP